MKCSIFTTAGTLSTSHSRILDYRHICASPKVPGQWASGTYRCKPRDGQMGTGEEEGQLEKHNSRALLQK